MFSTRLPRDLFTQLDALQREVQDLFELTPSIRGIGRGGFPALNIGSTPESVEIYAFAPGIDPGSIDLRLDRGVLTISGERTPDLATKDDAQPGRTEPGAEHDARGAPRQAGGERTIQHVAERFVGAFRRVVSLPDDIDPERVNADYRDGVLHIRIDRRASAQPKRIAIQ
ncbi:MAG: Hsp20/alpha crystallin family protein [Lautropia sp.]